MTHAGCIRLGLAVVGVTVWLGQIAPVLAAVGSNLASFDAHITAGIPTCADIGSPAGTGVAFDGSSLILSCWNSNVLQRVDAVAHTNRGSLQIAGTSDLGALAYDGKRGKLWACDGQTSVVLVDLSTQAVDLGQPRISVEGCVDGLAYDGHTDTIWASEDVASSVQHYELDGTLLDDFPIGGALGNCGNSGIAVGGDLLYLANNGCSEIYTVAKDFGTSDLLATFPARLEDLECDDLTFAPKSAIWSIDAYDRTLNAWEIPPGACASGGGTADEICDNGADDDGDGLVDDDDPDCEGFDDGQLLQTTPGSQIYVIYGGAKFLVTGSAFGAMLFDATEIDTVPDASVVGLPTIPQDGTVLHEFSDSNVYLVEGGRRSLVPDLTTLSLLGFDLDDIAVVPDGSLAAVPLQAPTMSAVLAQAGTTGATAASRSYRYYCSHPAYRSTAPFRFLYFHPDFNPESRRGMRLGRPKWQLLDQCFKISGTVEEIPGGYSALCAEYPDPPCNPAGPRGLETINNQHDILGDKGDKDIVFNLNPDSKFSYLFHLGGRFDYGEELISGQPACTPTEWLAPVRLLAAAAKVLCAFFGGSSSECTAANAAWSGAFNVAEAQIDAQCRVHIEFVRANQPICRQACRYECYADALAAGDLSLVDDCVAAGAVVGVGKAECKCDRRAYNRFLPIRNRGQGGTLHGRRLDVVGPLVTDQGHRGEHRFGPFEIHPAWRIRFRRDATAAVAAATFPFETPPSYPCAVRCCRSRAVNETQVTYASECVDYAVSTCESNECPMPSRIRFNGTSIFKSPCNRSACGE